MTDTNITQTKPVLVTIDISKARYEVLIAVPGKKRRRRLTWARLMVCKRVTELFLARYVPLIKFSRYSSYWDIAVRISSIYECLLYTAATPLMVPDTWLSSFSVT